MKNILQYPLFSQPKIIRMPNTITAIHEYLDYGDHSLAVRRMLDASLDTRSHNIIQKAIDCSRQYRQSLQTQNDLPVSVAESIRNVLSEIENTEIQNFQPQVLMTANNIEKKYKKGSFTLHSFNLAINTGDVLGVVGENGNGKTTLLSCLAGQLATDKGNISYTLIPDADHYDIKHHVAFIPQRIPEWYGMLKDNLHFSAALSGVTGDENNMMVDFMLERLGLSSYAHLTWKQISSGYRTRFEIARVLLQKPSLLILDEPLANLDINAQQTLLTDLRFMAKSLHQPMGIILSSQQLHEVEKVADTVFLIKKGKCIHQTNTANTSTGCAAELESKTARETIADILGDDVQVQYNGGFFTISSQTMTAQQILSLLVENKIDIHYFRDITDSTKRYF